MANTRKPAPDPMEDLMRTARLSKEEQSTYYLAIDVGLKVLNSAMLMVPDRVRPMVLAAIGVRVVAEVAVNTTLDYDKMKDVMDACVTMLAIHQTEGLA